MRPPGSNYKNYCSSKLLMSCDVLPTCEEGLGVEKPATRMRLRGRVSRRPALLSHPGRKGSVQPDHKSKQDPGQATRGFPAAPTGPRLEHFFPEGEPWLSDLQLPACWGHRGALIRCMPRTELLIKAGKCFQTQAALQVQGSTSLRRRFCSKLSKPAPECGACLS